MPLHFVIFFLHSSSSTQLSLLTFHNSISISNSNSNSSSSSSSSSSSNSNSNSNSVMERQRSFSPKPTRLLVFTFTILSSFIILTFFTTRLIKATPLVLPQQPYHLNALKDSILQTTHVSKPDNASVSAAGVSLLAVLSKKTTNESKLVEQKKKGFDGNFTEEVGKKIELVSSSIQTVSVVKIETLVEDERKIETLSSTRIGGCDLTRGKWVYDESYNPLYTNGSCAIIDEGFNCQGNGRLDKDYMKFRWQPQDCDIPRFNATKMLELIRGKRLVFVGDSINRNQWESLLCMLMGAVKDPSKVYETHKRRITKEKGNYSFRFVDYKCTVEYYVSHFLVHEAKARLGQKRKQVLRIDAIDHGSSRWKGADILVFNTAHWWSHFKTKAGINYYQEGGQVHPKLDVSVAFRKALMTWASWVDRYINLHRTRVFFRSAAPSHFRGGQWNSGGSCKEATKPLETVSAFPSEKNMIAEEVMKKMKTPVTFLNITGLSEYRVDGHPSIYGRKSASGSQDCSHWCLPGIPDVWNELLYAHLNSN